MPRRDEIEQAINANPQVVAALKAARLQPIATMVAASDFFKGIPRAEELDEIGRSYGKDAH